MSATAIGQDPPERPAPTFRHVVPFAPPMPPGFFGRVTFSYQAGQVATVAVEETIKP